MSLKYIINLIFSASTCVLEAFVGAAASLILKKYRLLSKTDGVGRCEEHMPPMGSHVGVTLP